jgi:hypothetical protein
MDKFVGEVSIALMISTVTMFLLGQLGLGLLSLAMLAGFLKMTEGL